MQNDAATPVWDLPVRLFHWSLPPLLIAAWASAEWGYMDVHAWCGYTAIVLVSFRIAWGFAGGANARFSRFVRGPRSVLAYLRGHAEHAEGHNPAGGWSVLAMLSVLLLQGVSGLFNEDDIAFAGPLAHLARGDLAGVVHEWNFNLICALVLLHVGAVALYQRRGTDLLRPMLSGGRSASGARAGSGWLALLLLLAAAAALWLALELAPAPPPVFL